jgi:hypothetical protein
MPLVRIDLVQGKSAEYRRTLGDVVYEAMVDVLMAPKDDRFRSSPSIRPTPSSLTKTILVSGAHKIASLFNWRSTSVDPLNKKRHFTRP